MRQVNIIVTAVLPLLASTRLCDSVLRAVFRFRLMRTKRLKQFIDLSINQQVSIYWTV